MITKIIRWIISGLFVVACASTVWLFSWWLCSNKWVSWFFVVMFLLRLTADDRLWMRSRGSV